MTHIFSQFLLTGRIGKVSIGLDLIEMLSLFGCPDRYHNIDEFLAEYKDAKVRKTFNQFSANYGVLELFFSFQNDEVVFFKVYYDEPRERTVPNQLDDGWVSHIDGISKNRFKAILNEYGLHSKRQINPKFDQHVTVVWIPSSELQINFDEENGKDKLLVISKSASHYGAGPCINQICVEFT